MYVEKTAKKKRKKKICISFPSHVLIYFRFYPFYLERLKRKCLCYTIAAFASGSRAALGLEVDNKPSEAAGPIAASCSFLSPSLFLGVLQGFLFSFFPPPNSPVLIQPHWEEWECRCGPVCCCSSAVAAAACAHSV